MQNDSFDWTILDRCLAGDATQADQAALESWRRADASHEALLAVLIAERDRRAGALPQWNVEELRERIIDRALTRPRGGVVAGAHRATLHLVRKRAVLSSRARYWRAGGMAAAAVMLFVAGNSVLRSRPVPTPPPVAARMTEYRTARGQIATAHLADGTRVVLAPESRLLVPEAIGNSPAGAAGSMVREVVLEGRGFFDVVHDARRPFAVRTVAGVARDVGTEFEVRADGQSRAMRVTVVSGLVTLHGIAPVSSSTATAGVPLADPATLVTLRRGDQATLSAAGKMTLIHHVDVAPTLAWTRGSLVFRGMRLDEVVGELSAWYDLDVRLGDSTLANKRLVLTLQDEPAATALDLIALSLNLRVERIGRIVKLYPLGPGGR